MRAGPVIHKSLNAIIPGLCTCLNAGRLVRSSCLMAILFVSLLRKSWCILGLHFRLYNSFIGRGKTRPTKTPPEKPFRGRAMKFTLHSPSLLQVQSLRPIAMGQRSESSRFNLKRTTDGESITTQRIEKSCHKIVVERAPC